MPIAGFLSIATMGGVALFALLVVLLLWRY
jgi:hypothetical protein